MSTHWLSIKDCNAFNKHIDCEMKRRGSCSGGRGREKECITLRIVATPKRERPSKDSLVFVNTIPSSTSNISLRCSTRLNK